MPCIECGEPAESTRCPDCNRRQQRERQRPDFRARYGGARWDRLSKRARRLQPFCSDCGTTERLTCDHLPAAWERLDAGKVIRLLDVDVVCQACNNRRGSSRPGSERARRVDLTTQGRDPAESASVPGSKGDSQLQTGAD